MIGLARRRSVLTGLVCVALLAASCGGGGGNSAQTASGSAAGSSSSAATRSPEQLAADKQTAESVVLQLGDFPSGWEAKPRDPSTADTPEAKAATKKFAECVGVDPSLVGEQSDPSKARAESDKFTDSHDLEVDSSATVEPSPDAGQQAITAFGKPEARGCFQDFVRTALEYALQHPQPGKELPPGASVGDAEVGTVNLPGVHAKPVVYRVTVPVTVGKLTIKVFIDFVFALQGRTGLDMTFQNVGQPFPQDLETQLANTSIDRAPDS